jgi:hypothetical protein
MGIQISNTAKRISDWGIKMVGTCLKDGRKSYPNPGGRRFVGTSIKYEVTEGNSYGDGTGHW